MKIAKSSNTLNDILEKIGENIRAGNIALTSLVSGIVLQNGELWKLERLPNWLLIFNSDVDGENPSNFFPTEQKPVIKGSKIRG